MISSLYYRGFRVSKNYTTELRGRQSCRSGCTKNLSRVCGLAVALSQLPLDMAVTISKIIMNNLWSLIVGVSDSDLFEGPHSANEQNHHYNVNEDHKIITIGKS